MARHLNQVDQEVKAKPIEPASSNHDHDHDHDHDKALKLGGEGEHRHSDSTHSAIGTHIQPLSSYCFVLLLFMCYRCDSGSWLCLHANYRQLRCKNYSSSWITRFLILVLLLFANKNVLYSFASVLDSSGSLVITKPKATWTATLGLVVHAAADGIALGKN